MPNVVDDFGHVHNLTGEALASALADGWTLETPEAASQRLSGEVARDAYSGVTETIDAYGAGVARGFVPGADVALGAIGGEGTKRYLRGVKRAHPIASGAGEVVGNVTGAATGAGPVGEVTGLAARLGKTAEGAGAATKIARGALAGGIEGGALEMGAGINDLALAENPVGVDRIASELTSRFFYGGTIGAVTGGGLRGLEVSLGAARKKLAAAGEAMSKTDGISDDLLSMDRKALRARRDAVLATAEEARVPQRQQLAADVVSVRDATKAATPWEAVAIGEAEKTAENRWMREIGKNYLDADRMIDRALRNPKKLAEAPEALRGALQQQEHALEQIIARQDELRALHVSDRTGRRAAALDAVPQALESNRALQKRMIDISAKPSTPELAAIQDALDTFGDRGQKTLGGQMASGAAYGMVTDLVRMVPVVGPLAAPLIGARVADAISGGLGKTLAATTKAAIDRTTRAVDAFLTVTRKAEPIAPILSTRVLSEARFMRPTTDVGPKRGEDRKAKPRTLETAFDDRAKEISASVMPTPQGPKIRPGARKEIAARLSPLSVVAPHLADKLETHAVRRLEFLAAKMPKTERLGMTTIRPSEMAMRAWARYIAAADDPGAIEERLASGQVMPEDGEVMRELYPDRMAEIMRQIMERLPTLRGTLPYHRRLALSIFTGVPVDAAMDPGILAILQGNFATEEGTEGGMQAPAPAPAFGSVKKPSPTPAQERAG